MEHPASHKRTWTPAQRLSAAALGGLARWVGVKTLLVYRRRLPTDQTIPADVLGKYTFRPLSELEVTTFAGTPSLRLRNEFVAAALERGDICIGALVGNELAAYRWYACSGLAPCDRSLWVRNAHPAQIYTYKMYTARAHRGTRLQLYTMIYGDTLMAQRGFTHGMLYVEAQNIPSRRGLSRVPNQERVGIIVYVELLGRFWIFTNPGLKKHGFGLVADPSGRDSAGPHFQSAD